MSSAEQERAAAYDAAHELTDYLSVRTGAEVFLVPTAARGLGRGLYIRRSRSDITQLARAIGVLTAAGVDVGGSVFVDVGANIGTTTVTALRRHSFEFAVSIEPVPATEKILRTNLALNDLEDRAEVILAAVGERRENTTLRVKSSIGAAKIRPGEGPNTTPVSVLTLDGLVESGVVDVERVGLVWIDTAGHEAEVLCGASRLIAAQVPFVVRFRRRNVHEPVRRRAMGALATSYATATDLKKSHQMTLAEFDRLESERPRSRRVLFQAPGR